MINMEAMKQQITDCLKETIGQYYSFEQEEIEEKCIMYLMLINKKKKTENIKIITNFNITILNIMNKSNLKDLCTDLI